MLQPTSCGPGPPDKTVEFNNKNEKNKRELIENGENNKNYQIREYYKDSDDGHDGDDDNDDDDDNDVEGDDNTFNLNIKDDDEKMSIKSNEKQQQHRQQNIIRNSNTNNNCHLKNNIKFYFKQATEIVTATTKTSTTAYSCYSITRDALQQQQQQQQDVKFKHGGFLESCFVTTPSVVAATTAAASTNVANNLNKFYFNFTSFSTTSIKWILMFLMLFTILAQTPHQVAAEKSKHYYMQSLCKNHFLQQLYRKIDGAVLWSQNERNLDCIITFQTHSILQRFMLRFDMLQLDCNDHLYIYDGAHAVATPKIDISCRQTKQTVSSILTRTNFVTLKYVTDNWGTDANGFKLVITSVKDPKHTCKDFTCGSNGFCIHPDLLCDGINHCSDNSDESVHNLCQNETTSTIFGMDMTWFVMIVVSILLVLSAAIVGITICVCRRQEETNNQQNTAIQLHHNLAETNGSSKHLHYTHGGTLTREHTQLPPTSGNWHHPAGPYTGYHRMQRNYLKMATKVRPIWCLANFVN